MNPFRSPSRITRGDHKLSDIGAGAFASWTAAALCRFHTHRHAHSARGLAQSKAWRSSERAWRKWCRRVQLAGILTALLAAFNATAETATGLSNAEIQGHQLAGQILEQRPAEDLTNTGELDIRNRHGNHFQISVTCKTIVTEGDWRSVYQANLTNRTVTLLVIHPTAQPDIYFYDTNFTGQVPVLGDIPLLGHLFRSHPISGAALMSPFAGSDFWLCDLGLEFFHWPVQKILKSYEMRRGRACKVLESTNPNPSPNGYSRVVSWIDNETLGIVQAEAYDAKGKLLKEFYPKSFKKVNGQWELQEMEIRNDQTGSRTRLEFNLKQPD
jgi:Outer membrane lipoprotein-sorting protein